MGWFNEHAEMDDPMDSPRVESEFYKELENYWQELDDKERYSE